MRDLANYRIDLSILLLFMWNIESAGTGSLITSVLDRLLPGCAGQCADVIPINICDQSTNYLCVYLSHMQMLRIRRVC